MQEKNKEATQDTVNIEDFVVVKDPRNPLSDSFDVAFARITSKDEHRVFWELGSHWNDPKYEDTLILKADGTYRIGRRLAKKYGLNL